MEPKEAYHHAPPEAASPSRDPAIAWIVGGVATFVVSTAILLLTISRPPDPYANVGLRSLLYTIGPGEKVLPELQADLRAVYAVDEKNVWVAGKNLFIAHSSDGGVTWEKVTVEVKAIETRAALAPAPATTTTTTTAPPPSSKPRSAARKPKPSPVTLPADDAKKDEQYKQQMQQQAPKKPLIEGFLSIIEPRAYGATNIQALANENLVGVGFFDNKKTGVAVGAAGGFYVTEDAGATWTYEGDLGGRSGAVEAAAFTSKAVVVLTDGIIIGYLGNPFPNFLSHPPFRPVALSADEVGGKIVLTALAADGGGYSSSDLGKTWAAVPPLTGNATALTTKHVRTVVGKHGIINSVQQATVQDLHAVAFASDSVGWAVGNHGLVLRTNDGGRTWHHLTRESRFAEASAMTPAWPLLPPWYLFVNVFTGYAFVHAYSSRKKQRESKPATQWIEPSGETDRPLQLGDLQARNLMPLSKALADFLRNDETKPPLTIAITGEWGSGKSSLMNLVHGQLTKVGWRPVWFNAWHHQKEDSLLAALLQTIRMQAVPKIGDRGGLRGVPSFYARLFWIRLRNYWVHALALVMLLCFSLGFVAAFPALVEAAKDHSAGGHGLIDLLLDYVPSAAAQSFVIVMSAATLAYSLFKALSAFGVKPAQLLTQMSSGARIKDLEKQTTFRERFSREFSEVTEALNPKRSMLIFIDDLDRCRPENVVDVLEAVNFLVSSGECFVILGMARDKVQPAVGLAFEKMAAEMEVPEGSDGKTAEEIARARRHELARQYLDKLINIEVPVPHMSPEQCLEALTHEEKEQTERRWWHIAPLRAIGLAILTAIVCLLPLSMWFGGIEVATTAYVAHTDHEIGYIKKPAKQGDAQIRGALQVALTSVVQSFALRGLGDVRSDQPARILPPAKVHDWLMYWPTFVVLLLLLLILYWLVTTADEELVRDSDEFTKALTIWHSVLYEALPTPRALKRFKNRVRFMATYARIKGTKIREHAIVAIAARRLRPEGATFAAAEKEHGAAFDMNEVNAAEPIFDDFFREAQFN